MSYLQSIDGGSTDRDGESAYRDIQTVLGMNLRSS